MLTVQAECGLVTTNERGYMKVNARFYVPFYKVSLFGCPGARLLKVTVTIGPKMPFIKYQWL